MAGAGIGDCVKRVEQNQAPGNVLIVRHLPNHIECGKIGDQVRHSGRQPFRRSVGQCGKIAQVSRKGTDHEKRERENGRKDRASKKMKKAK